MRSLVFATVFVIAFTTTNYALAAVSSCEAIDNKAQVKLEQVGADIVVKVQEISGEYNKRYSEKISAYSIESQEGMSFKIWKTDLESFLQDKKVLQQLIVTGLFQLAAFDGEYDMVHSYASDYVHKLQCK